MTLQPPFEISARLVNGPEDEPLPIRICDLRCEPESPFAVTRANAALIAAAPELLDRLRDLCAVASAFHRWPKPGDPSHEQLPLALKAAYEAITKATGGQP